MSDRYNDREDRDKVLSNNNLKTEEILKTDREDRDDDRDDDRIAEVVLLIIPKQMIPMVHSEGKITTRRNRCIFCNSSNKRKYQLIPINHYKQGT